MYVARREILKEPYAVTDAIDDPLLTEGTDDVVFDTLSYLAGPLQSVIVASATARIYLCKT